MNKRIVVLGLLVAIMSVSASGAGFLGPPTAELKKGQWSAGYNYMYSDMDLEKTKITRKELEYDAVMDEYYSDVEKFKIEIGDVKIQRHYATIGYGITDQWEAYVQLGVADVKAKLKEEGEEFGMNFDNDFAWGWGTRYTFYEQENIRWGASVQMNWLDTSWDFKEIDEDWTQKNKTNLETYDLLVAVGPTVDMGGWKLYGGPFFYYLSGDLDYETTIVEADFLTWWKGSGDLENDSAFGGFIGAQFDAWENTALTTEFSFTGDSWAISGGIAYNF